MLPSMRENTLTVAQADLVIPDYYRGMQKWDSPEVADIVDRLRSGDPALGWEGDPRLVLYIEGVEDGEKRWVLYRLEHDGSLRGVLRSRPGLPLDQRLIIKLMENDTRRGFDPVAYVDANQ